MLLTHPGDIPQLPEAARLGAFIEVTASNIYKTSAQSAAAAALIKKIGAEHMIVSTDCGQTTNVYPSGLPGACGARLARQWDHASRARI